MDDSSSTTPPLEAAAGTAGPRAIEAFSILGDETRLSILLALWEAYEPWAGENAVPFSELRERLGRPDSGSFNYHIDKLTGQFIRRSDEGYELRRAGLELVRTVIAGTGLEEPSLKRTEIDQDCPLCGAPTAVTYRDGVVFHVCMECDGWFRHRDHQDDPDGTLAEVELDPAGVHDRSPTEMLTAAMVRYDWHRQAAVEGVCPACSGPMDGGFDTCADHVSEGLCPNCERRESVQVRFRCPVCKWHLGTGPERLVIFHPAVVVFADEHDVPLMYEAAGVEYRNVGHHHDPALDESHDLIAEDPLRVRVTFVYEGDELRVTLDEELNVVKVRERS